MKNKTIEQLENEIKMLELKKKIAELNLEIKKIEATKVVPNIVNVPYIQPQPYSPTWPTQPIWNGTGKGIARPADTTTPGTMYFGVDSASGSDTTKFCTVSVTSTSTGDDWSTLTFHG